MDPMVTNDRRQTFVPLHFSGDVHSQVVFVLLEGLCSGVELKDLGDINGTLRTHRGGSLYQYGRRARRWSAR
eukprot:14021204-Heterocapsa_arctica.AAC.1